MSFEGTDTVFNDVNLVTIRENTEGLYAGIEHSSRWRGKIAAESIAVVTRQGCERVIDTPLSMPVGLNEKNHLVQQGQYSQMYVWTVSGDR